MSYSVKEIFFTLQGEGANAGRPAVFCRFSGCNLWNGREQDRATSVCQFCDTDFIGINGPGGGKFDNAAHLAAAVAAQWPEEIKPALDTNRRPLVVLTGGEPALQLDTALVDALHAQGFEIAIETNGTLDLPLGIDWVCVSPKANAPLRVTQGSELKLVYPQLTAPPERFTALAFTHFLLQPMDGPSAQAREANTRRAVQYCLTHPQWRLSLQTHKLLGIP